MPDPFPRNRSARGRQARRPARQRVWPDLTFRRPRENVGPREPAPPQPRPPATGEVRLGELFRRPRRNSGPPGPLPPQPPPPATQEVRLGQPLRRPRGDVGPPDPAPPQPRPPARPRVRTGQRFRHPRGNVAPPGRHWRPTPTPSGTGVVVGVFLLAVAAFAVWIVPPLFPSGASDRSTAAPPVRDHTDVAAPGGPGPVGDQFAARPSSLAASDRGAIPASEIRHNLTAVHRGGGSPVAAGDSGSAPQPLQPDKPANATDLGQRVDPPRVDHVQRHPAPSKPGSAVQVPPQEPKPTPKPEPKPPVDEPPVNPAPQPNPQRERLEELARQFAQQGRNGDAGGKQPATRPQSGPGGGGSYVGSQGSKTNRGSSGEVKTGSGGGGKQGGSGPSGGGSTPSSSSSSK